MAWLVGLFPTGRHGRTRREFHNIPSHLLEPLHTPAPQQVNFNPLFTDSAKSIASIQIAATQPESVFCRCQSASCLQGEPTMGAISTVNTSTSSAIVSLINEAASSASTSSQTAASSSASNSSNSSSDPVDTVDLSDHAKQVLAHAQAEQVAADKLSELVQSLQAQNGEASTSNEGSSIVAQSSGSTNTTSSLQNSMTTYLQQLVKTHTNSDGTIQNFSVSVNNFITAPTTADEKQQYLQSIASSINDQASTAMADPDIPASEKADALNLQQALQTGTLQVLNATDIPGLNFQNTVTFSGGAIGSQANGTFSYNHNASIFNDPTTNYQVSSNGVVLAWPKTSASS